MVVVVPRLMQIHCNITQRLDECEERNLSNEGRKERKKNDEMNGRVIMAGEALLLFFSSCQSNLKLDIDRKYF